MTSFEEKSASQFISALVKNLQAVCHGHVEFDQNVKVVGHLYLTVDSATEFNYIVNEKVSKSDESSTTFISKSFYATDPQQKTPKKNVDRPLPPPTPNVLGKTRYDISVDLTDEPPPPRFPQGGQFSRPHSYPQQLHRTPPRRRPFDGRGMPHHMAKMPRLVTPQHVSPSRRYAAPPVVVTSSSPSLPSQVSIPPESVSATPAHSLPGADKPEDNVSNKTDTPDIKFEIVKAEIGSGDGGNKNTTEADKGEIRIESVTSHDLSLDTTASTELDSEKTNTNSDGANIPNLDKIKTANKIDEITPDLLSQPVPFPKQESETSSKSDIFKNSEVIEIDLTTVKDEIDSVLDDESSYLYETSQDQQQFSSGGENSFSNFGSEDNDNDEFFDSLQEQNVGLYPIGLHVNNSSNHGYSDIPNLPGASSSGAAYSQASSSNSLSPSNNSQAPAGNRTCPICAKVFKFPSHVDRHMNGKHFNYRAQCPVCLKTFSQRDNLKKHIRIYHNSLSIQSGKHC